jgi:hypothetical protein
MNGTRRLAMPAIRSRLTKQCLNISPAIEDMQDQNIRAINTIKNEVIPGGEGPQTRTQIVTNAANLRRERDGFAALNRSYMQSAFVLFIGAIGATRYAHEIEV